ncbi:chromosomal replication initiator protein DnaA [Candidatus Uhrbacteria bacterium]|nr:chromosomal replication initiator protein DnaA [Candidatus Uhrbacteria bacterium]
MLPEQLWQAVLGQLELSISKPNFTTWFKNTGLLSLEAGKAVVSVPNTFTRAWFEKKYHRILMETLQQIAAQPVREIFYRVGARPTIAPAAAAPSRESPFSSSALSSAGSVRVTAGSGLNPRYTFASFIVGKGNELAHAAARAVAARPGEAYNPLFLYGGVGLGKTHLLQGIGNEVLSQHPAARILYVTCETFTNDFIHAVRGGQAKKFKDTYRGVDVLLVDDIQFIAGKEGSQEEFFHTFNALHQSNKQIVLSSDRPPKAIPALEPRLGSRFEMGMIADIGAPDFETRVAILETKCQERDYQIDKQIVGYIATVVQHNVRELEGALNKLIAFHQLKNIPPTLDFVKKFLASSQPTRKATTPKQIIQTVALYFDLPVEDLLGVSREKRLAFPRQIIMYLLREELKSSYPAIGHELGGRDHTTAMHAYTKIGRELETDSKLKQDVDLIRQRMYNG